LENEREQERMIFFEDLGCGWIVSKEVANSISVKSGIKGDDFFGAKSTLSFDLIAKKRQE
jgi:hypothetical protein